MSKNLLVTLQDGNRGFISSGYIDGSDLFPGLLYQGEPKDMHDSWLQGFENSKNIYLNGWFTASKKGWTESIGPIGSAGASGGRSESSCDIINDQARDSRLMHCRITLYTGIRVMALPKGRAHSENGENNSITIDE